MKKEIEILSPAGSYECMVAAIRAGADAVYLGGTKFGARAYADNFQTEELLRAIDFVHLHDRKIYLTINTLLKDRELQEELYQYILPFYLRGLDAVIVQDVGVLAFIRKHFPDLPIHVSTQMTITDVLGAKFMEQQGVARVVAAREMQLDEIREIVEQTNLEIESFVHGALCYCYSGQCLFSSLLGGRSGNRGQCAQPCRLPYRLQDAHRQQYFLSLKDICTLDLLPELIESGIHSFKIEGRMKKPEYVACVTALYRKYTDFYMANGRDGYHVADEDKEKLLDLYNRGGFHQGYYFTKNGREMLSLKRPNHAGVPALRICTVEKNLITAKTLTDLHAGDVIELSESRENVTIAEDRRKGENVTFHVNPKASVHANKILHRIRNESLILEIQRDFIERTSKIPIDGIIELQPDMLARLILHGRGHRVEVLGMVPQAADSRPLDVTGVEERLRKTGNTEFEFDKLHVELHGNIFLPMQELNRLRRDGLEALKEKVLEKFRHAYPNEESNEIVLRHTEPSPIMKFHVYVEEKEQFSIAVTSSCVHRIYLDANMLMDSKVDFYLQCAQKEGKEIYMAMPHIMKSGTRRLYERRYRDILGAAWDGILIRNFESLELLREHQYAGVIVTDCNLYQFNQQAKAFWQNQRIDSFTAPLELNYRELRELNLHQGELIVYGHLPMMVSAQCIRKTMGQCTGKRGCEVLVDRYQKAFPVKNQCGACYNVIYNAEPLILTDQYEEISNLSPKALRLQFTIENGTQVKKILELYEDVFLKKRQSKEPPMAFTRGHFKRGIK